MRSRHVHSGHISPIKLAARPSALPRVACPCVFWRQRAKKERCARMRGPSLADCAVQRSAVLFLYGPETDCCRFVDRKRDFRGDSLRNRSRQIRLWPLALGRHDLDRGISDVRHGDGHRHRRKLTLPTRIEPSFMSSPRPVGDLPHRAASCAPDLLPNGPNPLKGRLCSNL
jgi:hypothetical protein